MYEQAYKILGGNRGDMSTVTQSLELIRNGIPSSMLEVSAQYLGVTKKEFAVIIGESIRTLQRKSKNDAPLSPASSEHTLILTELIRQADEYFEDVEKRKRWFMRPSAALGNSTPLSLCDTVTGINIVLEEINKLKYGLVA
ncbi:MULTISPECIES: antitoxin Xre/MbcA/ParS toxin-binding domain-containing protein [Vibrio]|uniref:type II RES/Xre toxin-antitoxin system antitoxin n=1 Tax=Vibrio TaxID=662 RepID=UPI000841E0AF|nr:MULTISPECIES: antitoxin Xre/MbcA/ParS toxin-binding domain-containing protein [Vibrio]ODM57030.1 hypothetical protein BC455_18230 [Vibrio harveyi]USD58628.1 DUF2384 domain-containing protein [Vibrio sp. SCSIO 43155]